MQSGALNLKNSDTKNIAAITKKLLSPKYSNSGLIVELIISKCSKRNGKCFRPDQQSDLGYFIYVGLLSKN